MLVKEKGLLNKQVCHFYCRGRGFLGRNFAHVVYAMYAFSGLALADYRSDAQERTVAGTGGRMLLLSLLLLLFLRTLIPSIISV